MFSYFFRTLSFFLPFYSFNSFLFNPFFISYSLFFCFYSTPIFPSFFSFFLTSIFFTYSLSFLNSFPLPFSLLSTHSSISFRFHTSRFTFPSHFPFPLLSFSPFHTPLSFPFLPHSCSSLSPSLSLPSATWTRHLIKSKSWCASRWTPPRRSLSFQPRPAR